MSWLLKFFVTAIIGILALKALGGSDDPLLPVTTDDRNYHVAVRYVDQPSHRMVIVGSSLSVRLSEDYFTSPNIENLALAGGSPETGLQIIAAKEPLPQLVLVEANILTRPVDARLIERLKARLTTATPAAFQPIRSAAAGYEVLLHPTKSKDQVRRGADWRVAQPAAEIVGPPFQLQAQPAPPPETIERTLSRIEQLVRSLRSRGTKVLFFEMPYPAEVERSAAVISSAAMARKTFPDSASWLALQVDRSELRWTDGAHLDERSAIFVARAIETAAAEQISP